MRSPIQLEEDNGFLQTNRGKEIKASLFLFLSKKTKNEPMATIVHSSLFTQLFSYGDSWFISCTKFRIFKRKLPENIF